MKGSLRGVDLKVGGAFGGCFVVFWLLLPAFSE